MKAKFFYTGIRVKDLEASVKFYTTLLGMKVRGRNTVDAAKGTVVELVCEGEGGNTLELNHYERGSLFDTTYEVGEGLDHLAFVVKDLDAALAEAEKAGHPVVLRMQEPGSRYAYMRIRTGSGLSSPSSGEGVMERARPLGRAWWGRGSQRLKPNGRGRIAGTWSSSVDCFRTQEMSTAG